MPKYAPTISLRGPDQPDATPVTADDLYRSDNNVFSQGLRSGATAAGGQLHALVGGVGEAAGAADFAKQQYAASLAAQQQAAAQAPLINDYHQINGVRSAGQYLAGQAGQMTPALAMGAVGAAAAPELAGAGALVGATLGTAPSMIGSEIQQQQQNPAAMQHSAGDRLAMAGGVGLAKSALMNVVPQVMGGKIFGRGAEQVAGQVGESAITRAVSKKAMLASNLGEGVVGNAAAGVGSEALGQHVASYYDPTRDTSQDNQHLFDAGAAGAIVGAPFGLAGFAGEAMHGKGAAAPAADGATSPGIVGQLTDMAKGAVSKMTGAFSKGESDASSPVDVTPADSVQGQVAGFMKDTAGSMVQRGAQVKAWAQGLVGDENLPDSVRAQVQSAASNIGDAANQAFIATTKFASDAYAKTGGPDSAAIRKTLTDIWGHATDAVDSKTGVDIPAMMSNISDALNSGLDGVKNADYGAILGKLKDTFGQLGDAAKDPRQAFETVAKAARDALNSVNEADFSSALSGAKDLAGKAVDAVQTGVGKISDIINPKEPVDLTAARKLAAGDDGVGSIDPDAYTKASPEAQQVMADQSKQSMLDQATSIAKNLYNNHALSAEDKASLDAMGGDFSTAANSMKVGVIKMATDASVKLSGIIGDTHDFIKSQYDKQFGSDTKSEMGSGIREVVSSTIMPFLEQHRPDVLKNPRDIQRIGDSVRMFAAMANKGDVDMQAVRYMHSIFGGQTLRDVVMGVHKAISGDADPAATKNFMKVMGKIQGEEISSDSLGKSVSAAMDPEALKQRTAADPNYLNTVVRGIRSHVDESAYANMGKHEADIAKLDFNLGMQKEFGSKSKGIIASFAKDAERTSAKPSTMEDKAPGETDHMNSDNVRTVQPGEAIESKFSTGDLADKFDEPQFHGKGFKHDMVLTKEAHARLGVEGKPAADTLLEENQKKYGGHKSVDFVPFKDLPKEVQQHHIDRLTETYQKRIDAGDDEKTAIKAANDAHGSPRDVGMVRTEGMKQEGRMSAAEFQDIRVDTSKTSHRNSPSRIDTGVKGAVLDAIKMVRMFQSDARTETLSGAEHGKERLAHVFMEAVAAAQDHLGKAFEIPDDVVVQDKGGVKTTWGEIKGLTGRPEDKAAMSTEELHAREMKKNEERKNPLTPEQIDNRVALHEKLAGMSTSELQAHSTDLANRREEAEQNVSDRIEAMKKAHTRFSKTDVAELYRKHGVQDIRDEQGFTDREVNRRMGVKDEDGRGPDMVDATETDPNTEIHEAVKGLGEKGAKRLVGMDGAALNNGPARATEGNVNAIHRDVQATIDRLEGSKNVVANGLGKKARALDAISHEMNNADSSKFSAFMRDAKNTSEVSGLINDLTAKYKTLLETPTVEPRVDKTPNSARAPSDVSGRRPADAEQSQWKGSELKKAEASGGQTLGGGKDDKAHAETLSRQNTGTKTLSPKEMREVSAHLDKVLPGVETAFKGLLHAGDYDRRMDNGKLKDFVNLSIHSLDAMGTAFHESLHGFIQHMRETDLHKVNDALYKAADSMVMRGKLEKLLANEPGALDQIRAAGGSEERAAYMYQFYHTFDPATGKRMLELNEAPRTIVGKIADFIQKTLGMWTGNERAAQIMDYFHSGEYAKDGMGDRNAVSRVLLERGTNKTFEAIKKNFAPIIHIANGIISGGDAALGDMHNPAIDKLRKLINPNTSDTHMQDGFLGAARTQRTQELNGLMSEFAKTNVTADQMQEALEQLQSGKPASTPGVRLLAGEGGPIRKLLDKMHAYMTAAGVDVKDMGVGKGYFPVVWDPSYIASNQKAFKAMLEPYVRSGQFKGSTDQLIQRLMTNDGNEFGIETTRPGMQSLKDRKLDFISQADRAPFLQKNLIQTINSYVTQATRRAEWARRFGDDGKGLTALMGEAVTKHGASKQDMKLVDNFIKGVDGTLGDDIDPGLRRLFGNAIVYQNIRLLPMAVFSMAVDPMGIVVRGGTVKDAFNAFKRGITEVKSGFEKNPQRDEWYKLSELMGTIDDTTLVHTLGSSYSQGMVGDTGRKINDAMFKYNLVEQMNTSMRVAAMPAALSFLAKHADGTNSFHSDRWLAELNLKRGDVIMGKDRPLLTFDDFKGHGMSDDAATAAALKMRGAVNKWVDGAILRPNAAHKPVWANDPHFALVSHLKQFVYSFNETIIKRTINEARHGNYTPAMALASYVPTMMAADYVKGMIIGGGAQPAYKDGWDFADYLGNGMQRAGLFSISQFGLDAYKNIHMGGTGVGALSGPMLEQIGDSLHTLGGRGNVGSTVLDAMPLSPIAKAIGHSGGPDSMFSD